MKKIIKNMAFYIEQFFSGRICKQEKVIIKCERRYLPVKLYHDPELEKAIEVMENGIVKAEKALEKGTIL